MPWISKRKVGQRNKHVHHSKRSNEWQKYYRNKLYKKLRDWYMTEHPLCFDCLFLGKTTPSEHLHHIVPISTGETEEERLRLLLDWENNWVALCQQCHQKRHKMLKNEK